jgi:hypothetical protein
MTRNLPLKGGGRGVRAFSQERPYAASAAIRPPPLWRPGGTGRLSCPRAVPTAALAPAVSYERERPAATAGETPALPGGGRPASLLVARCSLRGGRGGSWTLRRSRQHEAVPAAQRGDRAAASFGCRPLGEALTPGPSPASRHPGIPARRDRLPGQAAGTGCRDLRRPPARARGVLFNQGKSEAPPRPSRRARGPGGEGHRRRPTTERPWGNRRNALLRGRLHSTMPVWTQRV